MISRNNPLCGAPRIHGELLKLGIEITEPTVAKYMVRRSKPPGTSDQAVSQGEERAGTSLLLTVDKIYREDILSYAYSESEGVVLRSPDKASGSPAKRLAYPGIFTPKPSQAFMHQRPFDSSEMQPSSDRSRWYGSVTIKKRT
jgi:hypothetical protein